MVRITDSHSTLKLHQRFAPFAFAFYMAGIMAFLMCLVITAANQGLGPDYLLSVLQAYRLAMPCAFFCVLMVRPVVLALVRLTVRS